MAAEITLSFDDEKIAEAEAYIEPSGYEKEKRDW